jgi:signal peptidase I
MSSDTKIVKNSDLFADVEEIISAGGRVQLRVKGGSMRPFLRDGRDIAELAHVDVAALRRGMVVLFRHNGNHILHRRRRIKGDSLTIKGDGNYHLTELATRSDVVAKVISIKRDNKNISYRSLQWRLLSARSLWAKFYRTSRVDAVRWGKRIMNYELRITN